jgi:hypothetical protein
VGLGSGKPHTQGLFRRVIQGLVQMTKVGVNRPHCQTKKTKKLAGTPVPRKPLKFSARTRKVGLATIEWRLSRPMLARPGPSWHEFGG